MSDDSEGLRLVGDQVVVRLRTANDLPALEAVMRCPGVRAWWWDFDIDEFAAELDDPDVVPLIIEHAGEVVGYIQFSEEISVQYRSAGIDLSLHDDHQGKGYGSDAVRTVARYLFAERGHHRLTIDPARQKRARDPVLRAGRVQAGRRDAAVRTQRRRRVARRPLLMQSHRRRVAIAELLPSRVCRPFHIRNKRHTKGRAGEGGAGDDAGGAQAGQLGGVEAEPGAENRVGAGSEVLRRWKLLGPAVERDRQPRAEEAARLRSVGMAQWLEQAAVRELLVVARRDRFAHDRGGNADLEQLAFDDARRLPARPRRERVVDLGTVLRSKLADRSARPSVHSGRPSSTTSCFHCSVVVRVTATQPSTAGYTLIGAPRGSAFPVRTGIPVAA